MGVMRRFRIVHTDKQTHAYAYTYTETQTDRHTHTHKLMFSQSERTIFFLSVHFISRGLVAAFLFILFQAPDSPRIPKKKLARDWLTEQRRRRSRDRDGGLSASARCCLARYCGFNKKIRTLPSGKSKCLFVPSLISLSLVCFPNFK